MRVQRLCSAHKRAELAVGMTNEEYCSQQVESLVGGGCEYVCLYGLSHVVLVLLDNIFFPGAYWNSQWEGVGRCMGHWGYASSVSLWSRPGCAEAFFGNLMQWKVCNPKPFLFQSS